jgi:hypothetical protein
MTQNQICGRLPALEQNVAKYRAMEMVLVLFYAEDLRKAIIEYADLSPDTKNRFKKSLEILIAKQVLSKYEKNEIVELIDYRNLIAHRIEELNADIGRVSLGKGGSRGRPRYDYAAAEKLRLYRKLLPKRIGEELLTFAPLFFDATEKALKLGMRRLRRAIERQSAARKLENARLHGR